MKLAKKRESLDGRLAKLNHDERMLSLVYGPAGVGSDAERLVWRALALRGIGKALSMRDPLLSEGYRAGLEELKRVVVQYCTQALLDDAPSFFRDVAAAMRKKVPSRTKRLIEDYEVRLYLLCEAKAGRAINLSRFRARLSEFMGVKIDVRSLGRIAHRLKVPVEPRGRPRKLDR